MKISYNWLKEYFDCGLSPEETGKLLTDGGLEVESIESYESVKGGLKGLVVGHVLTREKHPDADRLSITTVDVGNGTILPIVCGAPNVDAGQKVIVAVPGAKLYPSEGDPFEIRKSKIRGAVSEGMICAEDEIGLGTSHAGIMVLPEAKVGQPASEYFKLESDSVFEIGITPNRSDALSHIGVARDLRALYNFRNNASLNLNTPSFENITNKTKTVAIEIQDAELCSKYHGLVINNIKVGESPDWLKNKLASIGVRSINNVVDVTNFVMYECGQPLHAFDLNEIKGNKVIVRKANSGEKFVTLDGIERALKGEELMIANASEAMCIAGVFGGAKSGVKESTSSIFLEAAYFDSVSVRKTSKLHTLKTDSSFRFERGADPKMIEYALNRAAALLKEICGAQAEGLVAFDSGKDLSSKFEIEVNYISKIIGKEISITEVKGILTLLGIDIVKENGGKILIEVPAFKTDVKRPIDVVEEILRIYGYNNIELGSKLNSSVVIRTKPDKQKLVDTISAQLVAQGFNEVMALSLSEKELYDKELQNKLVEVLNPLSSELNVLRNNLNYGLLQTVSYNINRKSSDLKLFEFGNIYEKQELGFKESQMIGIAITGSSSKESWNQTLLNSDFYQLKGVITNLLLRSGVNISKLKFNELNTLDYLFGLELFIGKNSVGTIGRIHPAVAKKFGVSQEVFIANLNFQFILKQYGFNVVEYAEVPKFPEVRRDLALLVPKTVKYADLEKLAYESEKNYLKAVNLFDVYEGEKLGSDIKSYALSFTLQDESATLTDSTIDKIMVKLMNNFKEKAKAEIKGTN